jgi:hypothetical protein
MPNPSSSRSGGGRGRKRGRGESKLGPDARRANLRESLAPRATGIPPDVQKQLILELLEATEPPGNEIEPHKT